METLEYTAVAPTRKMRRKTAKSNSAQTDVPKTPESELMSVEEYFGILRKRVNDYYDSL